MDAECIAVLVVQVPGCGADLSSSKAYYRRYYICELHCQKTLSVMLNGKVS